MAKKVDATRVYSVYRGCSILHGIGQSAAPFTAEIVVSSVTYFARYRAIHCMLSAN